MNAVLEHIILNVSNPKISFPFYKNLFNYFEYKLIPNEEDDHIAFRKKGTPDFWFIAKAPKFILNGFHRKNTGINHFAFHVNSKDEVDKFFNEFLRPKNIKTLYGSPKEFPEYTKDYYAVYFEDPDRIKLEAASFTIEL
jgi:catechol 2,3-dioxygenase-like lactoylglutathione lyase family enzyme